MLIEKVCAFCQGTGITTIQSSSFLGLIKREIPATCEHCNGQGRVYEMSSCTFCDGQGLVGNESEICRACNGTGKVDAFAFIPKEKLKNGVIFSRRCESCGHTEFEIVGDIETVKLTKSWEREEELRQVELVERVKVRCVSCRNTYYIPIDKEQHQNLDEEQVARLARMGVNIAFMYD